MTYTAKFQEFWLAYPQTSRKGKKAAFKRYQEALRDVSHEEIMRRLEIFKASQEEWYTPCWPERFFTKYLDDYEDQELPAQEGSDEYWRAKCEAALNSENGFVLDQFNKNDRRLCPPHIRKDYPQLFELRAVK